MGTNEATRVYRKFGQGAVGMIQENPYILCGGEVGIPFDKVDAMAASLGIAPDSKIRILSGMIFVLSS
jgi:exodeoxyribonuclease V alpha subunit